MEELLEVDSYNALFHSYHPSQDKTLGESWQEINRSMRRSLHLPQKVSEIPTHYHEYQRKRQLSEIGNTLTHHSSIKKHSLRERSDTLDQNRKERLKIIRNIDQEEQDESNQTSIRVGYKIDYNQEKQSNQTSNKRQTYRKLKEVKLNTAGDLQLFPTDAPQRPKKALLAMLRYPLLGKQNSLHSPSNRFNIIRQAHQENIHLEQSIKVLNQNQSEVTQSETNTRIHRHRSETKTKYEKLPVIVNLYHPAQGEIKDTLTIHANPKKSIIMRKSHTKAKSQAKFLKEKEEKVRAQRQFANLSRKYKVFLHPKLSKLRLSEGQPLQ